MLLGPFDVYPTPGVSCDTTQAGVCLSNAGEVNPFAHTAGVHYNCKDANAVFSKFYWQGNWNLVFVHEMGHGCFGFDEEYKPIDNWSNSLELCGHSEMNSNGSRVGNIGTAGYCSRRHCYDGAGYDASICNPNVMTNWAWMKQQTTIPLTWATPWANVDPPRTNYTNNNVLQQLITVTYH
jgi:hypothetical protein